MSETHPFETESAQKEFKKEDKRKRIYEIGDLKKVLSIPEGRRLIWRLLGKSGMFRLSFSANSNQTAFSEGARSIGLDLLYDVNEASVSAFAQMQNEHLSAFHSKRQAKEASNG